MPDRIIKESACMSETLNQLSDFEERFWWRLTVNCDDYGRFDARPAILKSRLFPLMGGKTHKDMQKALTALASVGLVKLYEVDGRPFLQVVKWEKHQRIRAKRSKFPEPAVNCCQAPSNVPVIQSNPNPNPIQCESGADKLPTRTRFTPPTVDEVKAYCLECNYTAVDPERFVNFYQSKGWKVGKETMKDWKAAVRYWATRDKAEPKGGYYPKKQPVPMGSGELGDAELEAIQRVLREG